MININPQLRRTFQLAAVEAKQIGREHIDSVTLTLGILTEGTSRAGQILTQHGLNPQTLRAFARKHPVATQLFQFSLPDLTAKMPQILSDAVSKAVEITQHFDLEAVSVEAMLMAMLALDESFRGTLERCGLDDKHQRAMDRELHRHMAGEDGVDPDAPAEEGGDTATKEREGKEEKKGWLASLISPNSKAKKKSKTPTLDKFTVDLTQLAKEKKLPPVVGRQREIAKAIQILGRKTKNNPVLIGEAGVGKTAIVEGIAQRIVDGTVPKRIKGKRLLMLDMTTIVAGSRFRGDFEERMVALIKEVKAAKNIILFIDELHTMVGAGSGGGNLDASNALKPALARGEISTIGATTIGEYRKHIDNQDAALTRRFRTVLVEPPTVAETVQILFGLRESYEQHHNVKISDEAIQQAAELSDRYVSDRFQPDKAIDLMDEAASKLSMETDNRDAKDPTPVVNGEMIAQVISAATGIPVSSLTGDERERLLDMEKHIHRRVIGQRAAVSALAKAIRRGRAGLKDPKRPLGAYLFLGPTGVGKTEVTRALQEFLSGKEDDMIRLDMSEYMEKHSVSRMIGAPPGYVGYEEGGKLTEAVRRRPYAVILFDEIEKAHPDVFNILLQIFEDGRLTDGQGRTVDFRNTICIMTSNIGAMKLQRGSNGGELDDAVIESVLEDVNRMFNPEFINRLDDIICFSQLTLEEVDQILELFVDRVRGLLHGRQIKVVLMPEARKFLLLRGFDKRFGARPMRRAVRKHLEDSLSTALLDGSVHDGDTLEVTELNNALVVKAATPAAPVVVGEQSLTLDKGGDSSKISLEKAK
jgi:ATP-dependent Clp protease ATP-binding subunit ClpC